MSALGVTIAAMLRLRLETSPEGARRAAEALGGRCGVLRLVSSPVTGHPDDAVVITADVLPSAADELVALLDTLGAGPEDFVLVRQDVVAPMHARHGGFGSPQGFAWVEVMGEARAQSRPLARYLALMTVAGVIAAIGVITRNGVLIVGAMAVSPDLLPICATCVGIVSRRRRLARRAAVTLTLGMLLVMAVAAVVGLLLHLTGVLGDSFRVGGGGIGTLGHTNYATVIVALAAGVAAMLTFETRASAAVGVAISVTTIPASAYLGVAIGVGQAAHADGAALVVAVNVVLLILAGSATLAVQRFAAGRVAQDPRSP